MLVQLAFAMPFAVRALPVGGPSFAAPVFLVFQAASVRLVTADRTGAHSLLRLIVDDGDRRALIPHLHEKACTQVQSALQ